jgi:hypothetical protein
VRHEDEQVPCALERKLMSTPFNNVVFVRDVTELDNADEIEAEFKRMGVRYRKIMEPKHEGLPTANFYCTEKGGERVSRSLQDKEIPHEWGFSMTVDPEDPIKDLANFASSANKKLKQKP